MYGGLIDCLAQMLGPVLIVLKGFYRMLQAFPNQGERVLLA